jgi:hypothetical protein
MLGCSYSLNQIFGFILVTNIATAMPKLQVAAGKLCGNEKGLLSKLHPAMVGQQTIPFP